MQPEDIALAEQCENFAAQSEKARTWISNNRDTVRGEYDGLDRELRRAVRFFKRSGKAARQKMCVGVFGPSQAGKSYLVSALARDKSGSLVADFAGQFIDFIGEINPEGGKESTGLVTRFTMSPAKSLPDGFPVQIRLLGEMDLVKVLANTYYADCEHREEADQTAISARLDIIERKAKTGNYILPDDLEELQEYLISNFQSKARVQMLNRAFWPRVLRFGARLNLEERIQVYSLIWNETEKFTNLLRRLLQALDGLGFCDLAYAPLSALIPRDKSIIDVDLLNGLGDDDPANEDILQIVGKEGKKLSLPRYIITALTAELNIVMREKPDDYFAHTDLLDFPGYRSRYKFDDIDKELQKPGILKEMFLRGKVAYLFQRYSTEKELNAMLLCIGPGNQEVQDLPGVINSWIETNQGQKPENRKGKDAALFFILTKFDMEFEQKKGAPSVESRWDNRLHASLLDFFGKQYDWPTNWDGKAFNNIFLLRNPNFRFDAVLDIDSAGIERGIRKEQAGLVEDLRTAFVQSKLVANHFINPNNSFEAAMLLNDGGIGLIREKLCPICNPAIKRAQLITGIKEQLERLTNRLKPFWQTDDKEEIRLQKNRFALHLLREVFGKMPDKSYLGEMVRSLRVTDHDLYDLYFDAKANILTPTNSSNPQKNSTTDSGKTDDLEIDALVEELFDPEILASAKPGKTEKTEENNIIIDEEASFAALIESKWLSDLHQMAENPVLQARYGFTDRDFSEFISELALGSARLELRKSMEEALRRATDYTNLDSEHMAWKKASLATNIINNYVDFLGYNPHTLSEKERTVHTRDKSIVLFASPPDPKDFPILPEKRAENSSWKNNWLRALAGLISANVDFDGKQIINIEQNTILGDILRHLEFGIAAKNITEA